MPRLQKSPPPFITPNMPKPWPQACGAQTRSNSNINNSNKNRNTTTSSDKISNGTKGNNRRRHAVLGPCGTAPAAAEAGCMKKEATL